MPARKGQPNLTNDPGRRPGWEKRVVERIKKDRYARAYFQAGPAFFSALRRAAKLRGMNANAYMRRAVAAFAAKDLGERFEDILDGSPGVNFRKQDPKTGLWVSNTDDGKGYGTWEVK